MQYFNALLKFIVLVLILIHVSCTREITGPAEGHIYNNTWEISSPQAQGLDSLVLSSAFEQAGLTGFMDGLLIIKNGYIIAEEYYNGYYQTSAHSVMSVSKSFLSAITGLALREGYLDNLDQKMLDFFPEYDNATLDPRKRNITLRHLLQMRGGIEDERYNYSLIYNTPSWIKTTIEFPLIYDPGTTFSYNTFLTHLLSAILEKSSGMTTKELCDHFLFEPMDINVMQWQLGPDGYYFGGNGMYFKPRDMALLGYLYLHDGNLNGIQVVPTDWVRKSLTNYTGFDDAQWGNLKNINYGYLWWLGEMGGYQTFQAVGYGGQFVMCFPRLDMVIVTTAKTSISWATSDQQIERIIQIIFENIMPALN